MLGQGLGLPRYRLGLLDPFAEDRVLGNSRGCRCCRGLQGIMGNRAFHETLVLRLLQLLQLTLLKQMLVLQSSGQEQSLTVGDGQG